MVGKPLQFHFAQAFGERGGDFVAPVQEIDIISTVRINETGDLIATGDRGGRVVILEKVEPENDAKSPDEKDKNAADDEDGKQIPEYRFWTQFQSHEPEFDYLKSMEIEEKINQMRWCSQGGDLYRLLTTNDKTVKLWRVSERSVYEKTTSVVEEYKKTRSTSSLCVPNVNNTGSTVRAQTQQVYSGGHAYHINSLSVCADQETFISSDDLRVNIWHYESSPIGFTVLDLKPDNMEELVEVITAVDFHPKQCNLFANSSSRGFVNLCDLRTNSLCSGYARVFENYEDQMADQQSFFSEIIASVSDLKFSPCGRYILTRDYMMLRLWDMNMEAVPLREIAIHENLRPRLCELYENDCVFDKFYSAFSSDGDTVATGSYNGVLQLFSLKSGDSYAVETSVGFATKTMGSDYDSESVKTNRLSDSNVEDLVDATQRVTQVHISPSTNVLAAAIGPALYVYYA